MKLRRFNEADEWEDWYNWENVKHSYIFYDESTEVCEKLEGASLGAWIRSKHNNWIGSNFSEEDWGLVANLDIAESCKLGGYIITRVK